MFSLKVREDFDAAHRVAGYPGKCDNLHGHTWTVEVEITGDRLDDLGMVVDFRRLKSGVKEILAPFDHYFLNDVPPFDEKNPTAENIAVYIYKNLADKFSPQAKVAAVTVWESPNASVTYRE